MHIYYSIQLGTSPISLIPFAQYKELCANVYRKLSENLCAVRLLHSCTRSVGQGHHARSCATHVLIFGGGQLENSFAFAFAGRTQLYSEENTARLPLETCAKFDVSQALGRWGLISLSVRPSARGTSKKYATQMRSDMGWVFQGADEAGSCRSSDAVCCISLWLSASNINQFNGTWNQAHRCSHMQMRCRRYRYRDRDTQSNMPGNLQPFKFKRGQMNTHEKST